MKTCDLTVEVATRLYRERIEPRLIFVEECHTINLKARNNGYKHIHCRPLTPIGIHIITAIAFYGQPIEDGQEVLHHCDHPWCCNPAHIFFGTQDDNLRDMDNKGRRGTWHPNGEINPAAKLNKNDVQTILESDLRNIDLAHKFNVSKSLISAIRRKKAWNL